MRSVFNNAMCAHVWAQQNQEEGRSNNTSFRGECFFSYREPIARIVQRGCGPARRRALLVTHRRFSVTTSGHTSGAWIAARHISPHFNVLDVGNTKHFCREAIPHRENLADYAERIASAFAEARRARTQKPWKVDGAIGLVNEANAYAAFFGLKRRYRMPANLAELQTAAAAETAKQETRTAEREAKCRAAAAAQREEDKETLALWLAGVAVRFPHSWDDNGIRLRVVGETVETSRGAVVPLAHCRRILALCRAGKEYVHNGHTEHVGQFRVDHIDVEGNVMAGCHFIPRAEIDRIAALLQW